MERRKDCEYLPVSPSCETALSVGHLADLMETMVVGAYCELPASPKPFDYTELVEGHGGEEDFGAVGVCQLPC